MGVDITIKVYSRDKDFKGEIDFGGRCSEWFNDLQNKGHVSEIAYEYLDDYKSYDVEDWDKEYKEYGYGGFRVSAEDYVEWYNLYKPYLKAGWVSKYDAWLLHNKNIPFNLLEVYHNLPEENSENYEWIEYEDEYECGGWLVRELAAFEPTDYLIIYFDC